MKKSFIGAVVLTAFALVLAAAVVLPETSSAYNYFQPRNQNNQYGYEERASRATPPAYGYYHPVPQPQPRPTPPPAYGYQNSNRQYR